MRTIGALLVAVGVASAACAPQQQQRAARAIEAAPVPESGGTGDFRERKSIIEADQLRNRSDVIFFAYHLADDGQLVDQWACLGSPTSSTESVEPNNSKPYYARCDGWRVNLEGDLDGCTPEMMGIDGTYGEPAPFLFCITPSGGYEQWSIFDKVRVTTTPRKYPQRLVRVDEEQVLKLAEAQRILSSGGCVDDALNKAQCKR